MFVVFDFFFDGFIFPEVELVVAFGRKSMVHVRVFVVEDFAVSDTFGFVVVLVVLRDVVFPGGGFGVGDSGSDLSEFVVGEFGFLVSIDVEVADRVNGNFLDFGLSGVSPVSLNSGKVPLVNNSNNGIAGTVSVKLFENVSVLQIDENAFLVRRHLLEELHPPVHAVGVQSLGIGLTTHSSQQLVLRKMLTTPESVVQTSDSAPNLSNRTNVSLHFQTLKNARIQTQVTPNNSTILLHLLLNRPLHLQTRSERMEVSRETLEPVGEEEPGVQLGFEE